MGWIVLVVWLLFAISSFALFVDGWRREFDVDRGDAAMLGMLSVFGPASLLAAFVCWLGMRDWGPSPVIWRRK